MRRKRPILWVAAVLVAVSGSAAWAHFQVLLPARDVVSSQDGRTLDLSILFTHPMEQGPVMEMGPPRQFGVLAGGTKQDLRSTLKPIRIEGKAAYQATVRLMRPGDHIFYIEPAPYYEPAEKKMIIHYTKVVVDFLGGESAWGQPVGFPVEIEPLVRPFGLWTGNQFRGIVRHNGQPVPFATVEVEYYNEGGRVQIPNDALVTQVVKADAQGVFSYTMPKAGWWGFAALVDGEERVDGPDGEPVDVELGGLIWVKTVDME